MNMNESSLSIGGSTGPSRGDSPDSATLARTQLRQVTSPVQQLRDRVPSGLAQAASTAPASNLLPPPPKPLESKEPVSENSSSRFRANGYEVRDK